MTIKSSGTLGLNGTCTGGSSARNQIGAEVSKTAGTALCMNNSCLRTLSGTSSGTSISFSTFYGKSNSFTYTISSNQTNLCMRAGAVSAGWNQSSKLNVVINSGVYVSSNSTGTPALTISGSYPNGVTLTNNGVIAAIGGNGGNGGGSSSAGASGATGGTAIKVTSAISVTNNGTIAGGGGGGGGGGGAHATTCVSCSPYSKYATGGGGGGGRSGKSNSAGGSGYAAGGAGTCSSAGGAGAGQISCGVPYPVYAYGGSGGSGGTWGATGTAGNAGVWGCQSNSSGASYGGGGGGAGGKATCGAGSYITWVATGTRYGSIS